MAFHIAQLHDYEEWDHLHIWDKMKYNLERVQQKVE
jgi:hypothetical protein